MILLLIITVLVIHILYIIQVIQCITCTFWRLVYLRYKRLENRYFGKILKRKRIIIYLFFTMDTYFYKDFWVNSDQNMQWIFGIRALLMCCISP
jgi:hypothetical protein